MSKHTQIKQIVDDAVSGSKEKLIKNYYKVLELEPFRSMPEHITQQTVKQIEEITDIAILAQFALVWYALADTFITKYQDENPNNDFTPIHEILNQIAHVANELIDIISLIITYSTTEH